ncbi:hypothetical protein BC940DRAFT_313408 [Gongronella butleri]|nr:hypothetical protein BC940DRAFT_313408 [Gongronella butleri]
MFGSILDTQDSKSNDLSVLQFWHKSLDSYKTYCPPTDPDARERRAKQENDELRFFVEKARAFVAGQSEDTASEQPYDINAETQDEPIALDDTQQDERATVGIETDINDAHMAFAEEHSDNSAQIGIAQEDSGNLEQSDDNDNEDNNDAQPASPVNQQHTQQQAQQHHIQPEQQFYPQQDAFYQQNYQFHQRHQFQPMHHSMPAMPVFGTQSGAADDNEDLTNMIMAWYYSGYYTGVYQARNQRRN